MKNLILIFLLLTTFKSFSCDCEDVNPILEFYSSKYVFEGEIISKRYSKDSLNYKVIFAISKHYKTGGNPKTLEFELPAEGEYTGEWTSCDWSADKGQKWLVYAFEYQNKIRFSGMCSNSKSLNHRPIDVREQKMLDNGNSFDLSKYIFEYEGVFNYCENITDINSILKKGKLKTYKSTTTLLSVYIDSNGNLKSVNRQRELVRIRDSIFNLNTNIDYGNDRPITDFEKDAIELISQVKKWEVKQHNKTKVSVPYIRNIWVYFNPKTNKWTYEL